MKTLRTLLVAALSVAASVPVAQAQMAPRQQRGTEHAVFGGGTSAGNTDQRLTAETNAGYTYYDALNIDRLPPGRRPPDNLGYTQASGFLDYTLSKPYLQATGTAGGFAYYRSSDKEWFRYKSYAGHAISGHTWHLSRQSELRFEQAVTFQPSFIGSGLTGTIREPNQITDPSLSLPPDVATLEGHTLTSNTAAILKRTLTRRISLEGAYHLDPSWSFGRTDDYNHWSQSATATLRYAFTRHLTLRTGYRFNDTRVGPVGNPHVREHIADVGLEYNQGGTIQLTRRTTLALNAGASVVRDTHQNRQLWVVGSAVLNHDMARTWGTAVGYMRHVDFSEFYLEPLLLDTAFADFGGYMSSRLSFWSMAGYSRGTAGIATGNNNYSQANASAVLQYGLFRYAALSAGYYYYLRDLGQDVVVSRELSHYSQSQSVRLFLSAYAPLFHRGRRTNATR